MCPRKFQNITIPNLLGHTVLKSFLHKINAVEERKLFIIGETMPGKIATLSAKYGRGNKRFPSLLLLVFIFSTFVLLSFFSFVL